MEHNRLLESAAKGAAADPIILGSESFTVRDDSTAASGEAKFAAGAAPATPESTVENTPKGGGDTMENKKETRSVWGIIGTIIGILILALLVALLLKGCNGTVIPGDEVADLRAQLAAANARADAAERARDDAERRLAEESERVDKLLAEPRVGDITLQQQQQQGVDVDWDQWVHIDTYNILLDRCNGFEVRCGELEQQIRNHVCTSSGGCDGSCGIYQLQQKYNSLLQKWETHVCPSTDCNGDCENCRKLRADLAYALDEWAKDQEELKKLRAHVCPSTACNGDCETCKKLRNEIASWKEKYTAVYNELQEYKTSWDGHTCPTSSGCDGSCGIYTLQQQYNALLQKYNSLLQQYKDLLATWENHVCPSNGDTGAAAHNPLPGSNTEGGDDGWDGTAEGPDENPTTGTPSHSPRGNG